MELHYSIAYGDFALRAKVSVGSTPLASYTYSKDGNHYLTKLDYGNGDDVKYTYDSLGRVTKAVYTESDGTVTRTVTYTYDNVGALATVKDSKTGRTTKYSYDTVGRVTGRSDSNTGNTYVQRYSYDDLGNLETLTDICNGTTYTTEYVYDGKNRLYSVEDGNAKETASYDAFDRLDDRTVFHNNSKLLTKNIGYEEPLDNTTSDRVASWSYTSPSGYSIRFSFNYDSNGNITKVQEDGYTTTYVYDSANQLIRENNEKAEKTWTWQYDAAGNILNRKEYDYTTASGVTADSRIYYLYEDSQWGDLLTSYNGKTITYDEIGNPLSDGTWNYTWAQGRQLTKMQSGSVVCNYTYDADGLRTSRSYGTANYTYRYVDGKLTQMVASSGGTMHFTYGTDGRPLSITYGGATYYYVLNLQGDVVAILDSTGALVVEYVYDAWGRVLSTTGSKASSLGLHNPLRYRGYVYDRETGLYYLQSRYYNPNTGRFLNADSLIDTSAGLAGYNLFAYCANNPIVYADSSGQWIESVFDLFSLGVSVVEVVINPADPWAWAGLGGDALDLIPFVTGLGEGVKGMRVVAKSADLADDALDTIRFAKAVDFTDDALDTIKTLDKAGEFTQSTASAGRRIHKGYKALQIGKEYAKIPGIRMDFFDGTNVFELKPYNKRALQQGVNQLIRYSKIIDHPVSLILEFY